MLAVRLPSNIEKRLEKPAHRTGRSKTFYAREAILRYLDELEDIGVAVDRLEKPAKRWTLQQMEDGRDLEGLRFEG